MAQTIEQRLEALEKWKADREQQQIVFPLDTRSFQVLNKYFLSQVNNIWYVGGASGVTFKDILVQQDGNINSLTAKTSLIRYSVSTTADTLLIGQDIVNKRQGVFEDDQRVTLFASGQNGAGDVPGGLETEPAGGFYVVNATQGGTVIQLSNTLGGAAINITSSGTGEQYIQEFV